MKTTVHHIGFGTIEYEESFFTGRPTLFQNGRALEKQEKRVYLLWDGERAQRCRLVGNSLWGARLVTEDGESITLTPAYRWYEITLAVLVLAIMVVWGNSRTLCSLVPVVGGAIGGCVTGVCIGLGLVFTKAVKRPWAKILVWLGTLCVAFLLCMLIGVLIEASAR